MKRLSLALAVLASIAMVAPASANVVVPVESDFYTTAWGFGAPYVRDIGNDSCGVSTPNPFLFAGDPENAYEETTYFTFDFQPSDFGGPVTSALLEVETVLRTWGSYPNASEAFAISAHRVMADPTTIDPNLASGSGSYVEFKNTQIGAAEDTVSLTGVGVFTWDITDLVNEWIANSDASFDYSIAMTGRIGNTADTDSAGGFHAFVNSEGGLGGVNARIVVPEPATFVLLAIGAGAIIRRSSRRH